MLDNRVAIPPALEEANHGSRVQVARPAVVHVVVRPCAAPGRVSQIARAGLAIKPVSNVNKRNRAAIVGIATLLQAASAE